ncbi:MAG: hypothetical protein R3F44_08655 [Candidatus Competibacteraceae bacterium]
MIGRTEKLLGGLLFLPLVASATQPQIVTSIKPVHSVGGRRWRGRTAVVGVRRCFAARLQPETSEARAIDQAHGVLDRAGSGEFSDSPLDNVKDKIRVVALLDSPGMTVLPPREGGAWEPREEHGHDEHGHETPEDGDDHEHEHVHQADHDPHVWLARVNAIAMVRRIMTERGEVDVAHRARLSTATARR